MKKILLLFSFFILSFLLCNLNSLQAQTNLIPNGDFELGPDSSSIGWGWKGDSVCTTWGYMAGPDFWTAVAYSPDRLVKGSLLCSRVDSAASGNACIDIGASDMDAREAGKATLVNPIQKDSMYKFSGYASFQPFTFDSLLPPMRFEIKFNNNKDSLITPFYYTTQWKYWDTIFIASDNATEIDLIGVWDGHRAAVNIDNIKLEKKSSNGIEDYFIKANIKVFPNPATDNITIEIKELQSTKYYLSINDIVGNTVLEKTLYNKVSTIDVSALAKGMYFIKVKSEKGVAVKKFIKE